MVARDGVEPLTPAFSGYSTTYFVSPLSVRFGPSCG